MRCGQAVAVVWGARGKCALSVGHAVNTSLYARTRHSCGAVWRLRRSVAHGGKCALSVGLAVNTSLYARTRHPCRVRSAGQNKLPPGQFATAEAATAAAAVAGRRSRACWKRKYRCCFSGECNSKGNSVVKSKLIPQIMDRFMDARISLPLSKYRLEFTALSEVHLPVAGKLMD